MRKIKSSLRGHSAITGTMAGLLAAAVCLSLPATAQAEDWLDSIQDSRCDPEDIEGVTGNVRNAIEASVRRAEMSIQAPTSVGDLGCLNDLMTAPLDIFSGVGGLLDSLSSGLGSLSASSLNIDLDVSGMVCGFAAKKFADLTSSLGDLDMSITEFASLASSASDRVNGAISSAFTDIEDGLWDSSDDTVTSLSSVYDYSGVSSTTDSSGYSGSITSYVAPDTTASESDVETVVYEGITGVTDTDQSDEWAQYNQNLMEALGEYIGCRVAGELDGTSVSGFGSGTWNVPGTLSGCSFNPGGWPAAAASDETVETREVYSEANSSSSASHDVDRVGGQDRSEVSGVSPVMTPEADSKTTIWDMLGK
jgi:hypothetical protein